MLNNRIVLLMGLIAASPACGSDRAGVDTLFDTSRTDVIAYEADATQLGLFNTTHLLAWDYELGYTGFESGGSIEFGPVSSIPDERLEEYLFEDQNAETIDAASTGTGGTGGSTCPHPIPPPSTSCSATTCCTVTYGCYSEFHYCWSRPVRR